MSSLLQIHPEVADALATGGAVVALESTILAHGLPRGDNRVIADRIEGEVRRNGAVPATIAVLDGVVKVGLGPADLDRLCASDDIAKLSVRDLGAALALHRDGATTVASTSALAHRAGISVFATGGLGGVHRGAASSFDVSADLGVLARTPVLVVCAGVKSILDVPGTLEYLETLSVPVLGYRTDRFPGFYLSDSGYGVPWTVRTPAEAAAVVLARRELATDQAGVVLANPIAPDKQLDPDLHDRTLESGLELLRTEGITGKDVTPRLLEFFHHTTHGASLTVNVDLVLSNASLAGEVAVALARAGR
ncbi:pseudouridine-5'-phosphate glycosidase [Nakamurella panacisegetis]|uniref:Pseudouridine-5'-phosphate glycosidase n=1 Tax=Nakamurella panacisegetis TaxID=1090615 RepID=A0A1H0QE36_9ACTN|nr:pseudouridine-5'-phosphate glycosidase [Nakamurella panacisegetis]SDP15597.1 pseudouridine-5'-phosphate glycosidase [Nakamurella panacisegetis]